VKAVENAVVLDVIRAEIHASIAAKQAVLADEVLLGQVAQLAAASLTALRGGGKVILAGNGGSFADAQHLSAEFTSRFMFDRAPLASLALGTNNSAISAIGNDYGYEQVFARELQGIAHAADVFIPISTSGNSTNIIAAVRMANSLNIKTVAWTGETGGQLHALCECIRMPARETARIQECHIMVGHILCRLVEAEYFYPKVSLL
jgi:D-sedoheptulose 7-phosphate isomerase